VAMGPTKVGTEQHGVVETGGVGGTWRGDTVQQVDSKAFEKRPDGRKIREKASRKFKKQERGGSGRGCWQLTGSKRGKT